MSPYLLAIITTIASASPLVIFAYLWQIKEWRIDRLREHLRSEGALRQLFGIYRPAILIIFGILGFYGFLPDWIIITIVGYLAVSILQLLLNKHPKPVWTKKAITLVTTALILTLISSLPYKQQTSNYHLVFIPLLQPLFLMVSAILWSPIDKVLKRRIMNRAKKIRSNRKDLVVIGITGSVGKTTTKELLKHLLEEMNVISTPEHVNTEMGVSGWISSKLPKSPEAKVMIVEMGAYREGEISLLCKITEPTIGVVSFVGTQHIGLFGSQEALMNAKAELIESLPSDGHAFLNADSELCAQLKDRAPCHTTLVSTGGPSDIEAFDIEETSHGIEFLHKEIRFFVPIHGTHNVTNVLLAIAVASHLGMNLEDIANKLSNYRPAMHTFAIRKDESIIILDDTHNASPASFKAAITWAKSQPFEHKTLLTSGLIELGTSQDHVHKELGALSKGVFNRIVFLNRKRAYAFEDGYEKDVEIFSKTITSIPNDSLLVCVGRMSQSTIQSMIPAS
ncbi:MAG: UDP-N-acetylmuramoyl-tripeptide--D-alanyl-D-alanine ligase [Candidatus Peribacteraceae bacterium]|jgi:UDP-N-acetylmuramoyl-tripeptide--D-alanyl-D-alanine ligase|nr:UDP-N-acetylmuramoyl-tripeptide--D-alanyl-D-alanine ligase [Candidatus Peribacteraceae bacterium]HCI04042.1 hypothetical protein [Candidatus Peribacteria bacterium]|tara:strand:- start:1819 stop:3342 length:1524 start_codon:yes stop_codon:yes gene_type:complete